MSTAIAPAEKQKVSSHNIIEILLTQLSRITSTGVFIPHIDALRFIAILTVFLFHLNEYIVAKFHLSLTDAHYDPLNIIVQQGFIGVRLFFAISGFILALPFASRYFQEKPPPKLSQYFLRRLTRLEPPYIINMITCFVLVLIIKKLDFVQTLLHFTAGIFYQHNITFASLNPINIVTWSLEVEVQFYILAPFISRLYLVKNTLFRRGLFIGLGLGSTALAYLLFYAGVTYIQMTLVYYLSSFLAGFLLVDLYLHDWNCQHKQQYRWDVIGFLAWILIFVITALLDKHDTIGWDKSYWYQALLHPGMVLIAYMIPRQKPRPNVCCFEA